MKILLPTDGSESAGNAIEFVRGLAGNRSIDVHILTVSHEPSHSSVHPWIPEWTEQERERTHSLLEDAQSRLCGVCRSVTTRHESGAPVPRILELAEVTKPDLIALGAKGHSGLHRILLGSVSDAVATHATCSVVVVRPPQSDVSQTRKIVLGFDQSIPSCEAVDEVVPIFANEGVEIDVVSVALQPYVYFGESLGGHPITIDSEQVEKIQQAAERIADEITKRGSRAEAHTPVASHVGEAIAVKADELGAELIVVGDTGQGLLGQVFVGSTSRYLLRHASCSVWVSRHHRKAGRTPMAVSASVASD